MSVFSNSDDRILLEEIVEAVDEQEAELCSSSEGADEGSVATHVVIGEHPDFQESNDGQSVNLNNHNSNGVVGRGTPRSHMEQEKRMRREIANSNERRRMQSINAGFQSLRTLLPHHEGEKLSKAAILQQTAEYIYQLEQEKTQLLSQNCQLKRLVNQHEGGDVPIKKRKADNQGVVVSLPMHVNESGDEGLGSMSPEPLSVITVSAEGHSVSSSEVAELRRQLERERRARLRIEEQMRAIQSQIYPERFRDNQLIAYQPHEVIEHTDNVMAQETEDAVASLQVVSVVTLPPVGSTQTVETTTPDPSPSPSPPLPEEMVPDEIKEEVSRPSTPKIVTFSQTQVFTTPTKQKLGSFSPTHVTYGTTPSEFKNVSSQFVSSNPTRPFSPPAAEPQRLPSVLEAAMKAEPKVEVERLPSPANSLEDGTPQTRLYLANTSRQNLETIVEAIRHLEGDHLFSDEPAQDVPLALTNKPVAAPATTTKRLLHAEMNNFLQFHSQQPTQQRPGVIVVKHS